MAKQEHNLTAFALTQYLDPSYWRWAMDDPAGAAVLQQGADAILTHVVESLEAAGCKVGEAYAIVHDKDERAAWSEVDRKVVTEPKPPHIHVVAKFADRQSGATIGRIAQVVGVEPQYVEKPGRGRFAWDNMLSYLTHAKYEDKYQYPPDEVATVRGPDYMGVDALRREAWLKGRASIKAKVVSECFEDMREQVLQGRITRDQIMLTDGLYDVYARHQREIDDALSAWGQRRAYRAADKLRAGEFSTQVVYVHGDAGIGKTSFAKGLIRSAMQWADDHGEHWQVYRAATMNPLDDWQGEEILFLDDLRAGAMDANDWLLLLDPYNASPARARYRNKTEVAPRLIIITATIEPIEFFFYARQKGNVDEATDQFIRRLASIVQVYRKDDILRYRVERVGKVDAYYEIQPGSDELRRKHEQRAAMDRSRYGRSYQGLFESPVLELTYGTVASSVGSADEAMDGLIAQLSECSRDVSGPNGQGRAA